jgi:hypothetical protein
MSMSIGTIHGAGRTPRLAGVTVVALYDPASGTIAHTHTVMQLEGGRAVSEDEAIEAARRHAQHLGHHVTELEVKLSRSHEHAARPHRIDPATGEFVPLEPRRPSKRERPTPTA